MTYVVPVGPVHPALKEPEHFRIEVKGEEIVGVDIRVGYAHRGVEKAFTDRPFNKGLYLSERICGICSVIHSTAFSQTVEQLAGIQVPDRARYIRTIVAELERIHSHLLWAGVAAHEIGFDTLFFLIWRDREAVMDILELVTGNRVNYGINTIGGVRRDIDAPTALKILKVMDVVERVTKHYAEIFTSDPTIKARCKEIGVLPNEDALKLCSVGPTARASGVNEDVRRDDPYTAYDELSFKVITNDGGGVFANVLVRIGELFESVKIIRDAIDRMPGGAIRERVEKVGQKFPEGEATHRVEAPRGELMYHIRCEGGEKPSRVRVRTPTYANLPTLPVKLMGQTIAEVPIIVASIDPCFCCTDRVTVTDTATGKSSIYTSREFRRMSKWRK